LLGKGPGKPKAEIRRFRHLKFVTLAGKNKQAFQFVVAVTAAAGHMQEKVYLRRRRGGDNRTMQPFPCH
jgi:hypothetical protein